MTNKRIIAALLVIVGLALGFYVYYSEVSAGAAWWQRKFRLGLDLKGGSHLVYQADVSDLEEADIGDAMESLREVIERRVNAFGVTEPIVQIEEGSLVQESAHRLIVELPGVTDVNEAIKLINVTPSLEFKVLAGETASTTEFVSSGLTGRYLERAQVVYGQQSINPSISVEFNKEGADLFAKITGENVGKPIGIYLDGMPISAPVVREKISDGKAEISGQFTLDEAKQLTRDLNLGALPVPIELVSTQTVGATLGAEALDRGIYAGLVGFLAVALFMILYYRLPGFVSVIALGVYVVLMLVIFKVAGVTITAAGIAGFILSVGMALDANVLIFERLKEEISSGKDVRGSIQDGFSRAWLAIRDSNFSSLISAIVLFWFGTSVIKGFALTLALGIAVSLFTAVVVTRTLLLAIVPGRNSSAAKFLFSAGFSNK